MLLSGERQCAGAGPALLKDSHTPNHSKSCVYSASRTLACLSGPSALPTKLLSAIAMLFPLYLPTEFLSFFQSLLPALFPLKRPAGNDLYFNSLKSTLSTALIRSKVNTTMVHWLLALPPSFLPPPPLSRSQSKDTVLHFYASRWILNMICT